MARRQPCVGYRSLAGRNHGLCHQSRSRPRPPHCPCDPAHPRQRRLQLELRAIPVSVRSPVVCSRTCLALRKPVNYDGLTDSTHVHHDLRELLRLAIPGLQDRRRLFQRHICVTADSTGNRFACSIGSLLEILRHRIARTHDVQFLMHKGLVS